MPRVTSREQQLVELPDGTAEDHESHNKIDKKVSKSWRWDVEQETVSKADASNLFRTTGDLFAYHALPVVRREFGPSTKKKFIRKKIEALLSDMTPAECYPWQDSRNKLWAGDLTMLQRVDPGEDTTTRGFARATPAPCTQTRLREDRPVTEPERTLLDADSTKFAPGRTDCPPQIKQEVAADSSDMTHETLLRSREQPGISPHIRLAVSSSAGEEPHLGSERCLKAPVMDILWGSDPFGEADVDIVVEKIMHTLNSRIKVQYIAVQRLGGSIHTESKKSIEKQLRDLFPHMRRRRSKWTFDNVLSKLEQRLVPWAIACPTSFPELRTYAIYFTHVMVGVTPATDLIYGTDADMTWEVRGIARDCIERNLRARGLHMDHCTKHGSLSGEMRCILERKMKDGAHRRGLIERVLRGIAFTHKDKFPELQSSSLVQSWERLTGLQW